MSVVIGAVGAMLIAQPSFSEIGVVYLIALLGTSLNALSFVLNRYSNRKDSPETTMAFTNLAGFLGSVPLFFFFTASAGSTSIPCLLPFLILGPLGMYAGIVAVKHAEASALAPYTLLRLVFGVIGATVIFLELPSLQASIGIALTALSCALTFEVTKGRFCSLFRRQIDFVKGLTCEREAQAR